MLEIIFGLISGTVTGMGMGGGAVLILLLSAFLGMEQHMAQATNLVFFVPTAIATIITNIRQKNINFKLTIITSIFGIIGAIIGSIISNKITSNLLKNILLFLF